MDSLYTTSVGTLVIYTPYEKLSRRLGHARPSITLDVYGHLIPSKQRIVADLIDELLTPISIELTP